MGTRVDEIQGNVKQGVDQLAGNAKMEREGEAGAAGAKLKRETEGAIDRGVGKAQETWGEITDDPATEAKGKARQAEGMAKQAD
jgi:uncharacterized protein YjbJ (UPF0337 family)